MAGWSHVYPTPGCYLDVKSASIACFGAESLQAPLGLDEVIWGTAFRLPRVGEEKTALNYKPCLTHGATERRGKHAAP